MIESFITSSSDFANFQINIYLFHKSVLLAACYETLVIFAIHCIPNTRQINPPDNQMALTRPREINHTLPRQSKSFNPPTVPSNHSSNRPIYICPSLERQQSYSFVWNPINHTRRVFSVWEPREMQQVPHLLMGKFHFD